jgi:hypothetical protein
MLATFLLLQVNRNILDDSMISFCKGQADIRFASKGMPVNPVDSAAFPAPSSSLQGGAFYDRRQNTLFTPNNIFWARFNLLRAGGPGALFVCSTCIQASAQAGGRPHGIP